MKRKMILAAIVVVAVIIIVAVFLSQLPSSPEQLPPSADLIVDQDNDPEATHSFGCGTLGLSMYQSFTPTASNLALVELRLVKGGSFPDAGVNTIINIRSGSPSGAIVGTATTFVSGSKKAEREILVDFKLSIPLTAGETYIIEWLNPAPAGAQSDAILSWMGREDNPYTGGNAFNCYEDPILTKDFNFKTFTG